MRSAVFLDRDGVINRSIVRDGKPYPPATLGELEVLPGVADALRLLRGAGFVNIVVTNQPDVRTGKQDRNLVEAIHRELLRTLPLDDIRACYHVDEDGCECRKPRPGMLLGAANDHGIDLSASYMVGDRWRDVHAGQAAGCRSLFIDLGYDERRPDPPFVTVGSLLQAANAIVSKTRMPVQGTNS